MRMEPKNRGDLTINGFGASNGGQFTNVTLNGKGTVNSDIECDNFESNGTGSVKGNLHSKTAKISGNGKITGNIESSMLSIEGRGKIENNAIVNRLKVSGNTSIGGNLKCEEMKVKGRITVGGNCETDLFKGECYFSIGGLLNADRVDVKLFGECNAQEIGGQTIVVRQKTSLMANLFKPFFQTFLETDLIEGDHIEIESTKAKIVRGNNVRIGPNCKIGLVEYSGIFTQDKSAIVDESKKM
jgi:cytoskeletal protein CcmA (bactofilin family)